ncbi:MAG: oxygen-independent coproporphyrinogen oxidase [Pseudomonadota bacterium]
MTVSSPLAPPSVTPLELSTENLALLDPGCRDYLLYPDPAQWQPFSEAVSQVRASPHSASLSLGLQSGNPATSPGPQFERRYLHALLHEIDLLGRQFGKAFRIEQLHLWGSSIPEADLQALLAAVRQHFSLLAHCHFSLHLPLNQLPPQTLHYWAAHGFRHLHLSLQAGEVQPLPSALLLARTLKFESVRIDLGFGLRQQPLLALARTLKTLVTVAPDQIALHPGPANHEHLCFSLKRLHAAGYTYLGGFCFTRARDPLLRAQRHGHLHRDLSGYTTHNSHHHLGCGLDGISALGNFYRQNSHDPAQYCTLLEQGQLPLTRYLTLSMDDLLRRIVIHLLICQFEVSIQTLELSYPIQFRHYFASELIQLQVLAQRGWLSIEPAFLQVLPAGQLFIYQICAVFDRYRCSDTTSGQQS